MTIDEAIEKLTKLNSGMTIPFHQGYWGAAQLGIEALKREKNHRLAHPNRMLFRLPGETKD